MKNRFFVFGSVVMFLVIAVMVVNAFQIPFFEEESITEEDSTIISITGNAKEFLQPNLAKFNVGVVTDNDEADRSVSDNAEAVADVKNELMELGINEEDIKTSYFYVSVNKDWETNTITGYTTTHTLTIETEDIEDIGKYIDGAVKAGANRISSIQFTLNEETIEEIKKELLADAVKDAKEKADILANAVDKTVVDTKTISISQSYRSPYSPYGDYEMYSSKADTSIEYDDVSVSVSVYIEFLGQ
ncbi:SIMPL domain-containing protein [Candidatus Micrarchaeota archaeon]|nr:SIMPL domain-containing protein [Candidatus Micrarchaeota archaeon]